VDAALGLGGHASLLCTCEQQSVAKSCRVLARPTDGHVKGRSRDDQLIVD